MPSASAHRATKQADLLASGQVVDGRFRVLCRLGRGGGGAVFLVQDQEDQRELALKVLNPAMARGDHLTRFIREYRVASRLNDPRFVKAHHFGQLDDTFFFSMDMLPGGSLALQVRREEGKLEPALAVGLMLQTLSGLDCLHHRGITHRDIKPQNLLLDGPLPAPVVRSESSDKATLPRVVLTDFGIARFGDLSDDMMAWGQQMGTPRYMAPELFVHGVSDPRVDLFAVGVMFHELLTGQHPLSGTGRTLISIREYLRSNSDVVDYSARLSSELPFRLRQILERLLSRNPWDRPRTAALVYDDLMDWWEETDPPYLLPEVPPLSGSPYVAAAPLIGRETELDQSRAFFGSLFRAPALQQDPGLAPNARRQQLPPSVLVVGGLPGVGKSRFVWQVLRSVSEYDAQVLAGQCKQEAESSYEGLQGALQALSGNGLTILQVSPKKSDLDVGATEATLPHSSSSAEAEAPDVSEPPGGTADVTAATVPSESSSEGDVSGSRSAPSGPAWRQVPSVEDREYELLRRPPVDGIEAIKQHELRQRLFFEQTVARLMILAEIRPVVLVVEDLQWADPSTSKLLAFLMRVVALSRAEGYPGKIAFILTHRPSQDDNAVERLEEMLEKQAEFERPPLRLSLEPLSRDQSVELTAAILMKPPSREIATFSRALFSQRDPTPLFVEQTLRLLLHQGLLTRGQYDGRGRWLGQWNIDPTLAAEARLPATVQEAIGERATRLSVLTQSLLALASVAGREFGADLLAQASGTHLNEVLDALEEATRAGFVQPLEGTDLAALTRAGSTNFRFIHHRHREALAGSLDAQRGQQLHLALASALVELHGPEQAAEHHAEQLAHHYACGGDDEQAHACAVRAADRALSQGAYERAVELYGAAVAAAERAGLAVDPALHGRYGDACVATGAFDTAGEQYALRLASLAPGLERWDTQRRAAELSYRQRDFHSAMEPLETLLAEMGHPPPRTAWQYQVRFLLGVLWRVPLLIVATLFWGWFTGRPARNLQQLEVLMRAWFALTECWAFVDFRRSRYHGMLYSMKAILAGDFPFRGVLQSALSLGVATMGLHGASRTLHRLAHSLLKENTDVAAVATAYPLLVHAALSRGETAFDAIPTALRTAEASGDINRQFMALMSASTVFAYSGRHATTRVMGRSFIQLGERYAIPGIVGWGRMYEGSVLIRLGRPAEALDHLEQAAALLEPQGDLMGQTLVRAWTLVALALLEERDSRLAQLVRSNLETLALLIDRHIVSARAHSLCLLSIVLGLCRLEESGEVWKEARQLYRRARQHCLKVRSESADYMAIGAFLAWHEGKERTARRMLVQAERLARQYQDAAAVSHICILAERMFAEGSPEHQRYSGLLRQWYATLNELPALTLKQISAGEVGPGPWS